MPDNRTPAVASAALPASPVASASAAPPAESEPLARAGLAKVIATIGPASESPEMVRRLITAGVSIFRFNFSHGSEADHDRRLTTVRHAADELGVPVACMGDLQGPKLRVGQVEPPGITVLPGSDLVIDPSVGTATIRDGVPIFGCTYDRVGLDVQPGQKVLINDGAIRLLALERLAGDGPAALRTRVLVGGLVTSGKGINLPQSKLKLPAMTGRDWEWAAWAVNRGMDFLALSFVRSAAEVWALKEMLQSVCAANRSIDPSGHAADIPVIAKIEKPQAIDDLRAICEAADGVMIARGDLGVETDLALVPVLQRRLLAAAAEQGIPCIVATQMLETMISSAVPTRAEANDVATAVFDGADAVMLSGESAVGKHPLLVVETMQRIVSAAEAHVAERAASQTALPALPHEPKGWEADATSLHLVRAAWSAARDAKARVVACWSQTGESARLLSRAGFRVPVLAYSSNRLAARRMAILKGVTPVCALPPSSAGPGAAAGGLREWNLRVDRDCLARGLAREGETILLIAGNPVDRSAAASMLALHRVGDRSTGFMLHA